MLCHLFVLGNDLNFLNLFTDLTSKAGVLSVLMACLSLPSLQPAECDVSFSRHGAASFLPAGAGHTLDREDSEQSSEMRDPLPAGLPRQDRTKIRDAKATC